MSPQSRASNSSRWAKTPLRRVVRTWYVAIVTGRISLRSPEYSPISSSVSEVRATSSRFHCRPATVFVTRINVVAFAVAGAQAPPLLVQLDLVRLAVDVAGQVLGRPAELEQPLLEPAPLGRVDG